VKRMIILALGLLLALALTTPMALAEIGQGKVASGTTEKLAAAWTQWAYSKPEAESPLTGGNYEGGLRCDGTPVSPTPGNTWFLAGTVGTTGPAVEETVRTCTMPVGTRLFFPVYSATFIITEPDENEQIAREFVTGRVDAVQADPDLTLEVTVDGKEINSNRIVRAQTPFFDLTFEEGNIFELDPGAYTTISDGLWVTLPPLPPGEHEIHFEFSAPNAFGGRSQNNTYILTVVNGQPAP
jgi:hypothetical protein